MEERSGLLADQVDAASVVDVVDVVPADALGPVLLLKRKEKTHTRSQLLKNSAKRKSIFSLFFVAISVRKSTPRDIT